MLVTKMQPNNKALVERVRELRNQHRRQLNDTHIFAQHVISVLSEAKARNFRSAVQGVREYTKYSVPSAGAAYKIAKRSDDELRAIYERFLEREVYENFLVAAVSRCESFLSDVVREILLTYPGKINTNVKAQDIDRKVPIEVILESGSIEIAIARIIDARLISLSYAESQKLPHLPF